MELHPGKSRKRRTRLPEQTDQKQVSHEDSQDQFLYPYTRFSAVRVFEDPEDPEANFTGYRWYKENVVVLN